MKLILSVTCWSFLPIPTTVLLPAKIVPKSPQTVTTWNDIDMVMLERKNCCKSQDQMKNVRIFWRFYQMCGIWKICIRVWWNITICLWKITYFAFSLICLNMGYSVFLPTLIGIKLKYPRTVNSIFSYPDQRFCCNI